MVISTTTARSSLFISVRWIASSLNWYHTTWTLPSGRYHNHIDRMLMHKHFRKSGCDTRVMRFAQVTSDHHLVWTTGKLMLNRMNQPLNSVSCKINASGMLLLLSYETDMWFLRQLMNIQVVMHKGTEWRFTSKRTPSRLTATQCRKSRVSVLNPPVWRKSSKQFSLVKTVKWALWITWWPSSLKVDLDILAHKAHGNIKGLGEEKWSQSNG